MAQYTYKSPMADWNGNREPLPTTTNADGKSLTNVPGPISLAYEEFPDPIDSSNNAFDFHIYYNAHVESEANHAKDLHERIRREFPELRVYKFWDRPVGPHPVAMFEVNVFNPHQTGALFGFLVAHRGPCSVLIHPNTKPKDAVGDHTERATWMGRPFPLVTSFLHPRPQAK